LPPRRRPINTKIGKLFISLDQKDKALVTDLLLNIGLCLEFKTDFRQLITIEKAKAKGKLLKLLLIIFDMTKAELDRVAGLIVRIK